MTHYIVAENDVNTHLKQWMETIRERSNELAQARQEGRETPTFAKQFIIIANVEELNRLVYIDDVTAATLIDSSRAVGIYFIFAGHHEYMDRNRDALPMKMRSKLTTAIIAMPLNDQSIFSIKYVSNERGDGMKKKKGKGIIIMTIVASLLGGCGSSKTKLQTGTKIEYERLVKALDEGDMKTVMSASDDGYAHLKEQMIFVTKEEKEDGTHDRTIYQTIDGIYNTKDKVLYGNTNQVLTTDIDSEKEKDTTKNYKKEDIYSTNIIYKNGVAQSENPNLDVSNINLIVEGLQGIVKMKPTKDIKEFSEPSSISYSLTESQFKEIINDNLKLEYDKFRNASIVIGFNSAKDTKDHPMSITEITLVVRYYKKNNQDKMLLHRQQIAVSFSEKVENTQNAFNKYIEYEKNIKQNK